MPETAREAIAHSSALVFNRVVGELRAYNGVRTVQSALSWPHFERSNLREVVAESELRRVPDATLVATFAIGLSR